MVELFGERRQRGIESGATAYGIDGFEAAGRNEPRPRIGGHAILWPLLQGRPEGIMQRLLSQVEVAEEADEGGEDPARFGTIDSVEYLVQLFGHLFAHHEASANAWPLAARARRISSIALGPIPCNFLISASLTLVNCSSRT
jgi:hypothetical protein